MAARVHWDFWNIFFLIIAYVGGTAIAVLAEDDEVLYEKAFGRKPVIKYLDTTYPYLLDSQAVGNIMVRVPSIGSDFLVSRNALIALNMPYIKPELQADMILRMRSFSEWIKVSDLKKGGILTDVKLSRQHLQVHLPPMWRQIQTISILGAESATEQSRLANVLKPASLSGYINTTLRFQGQEQFQSNIQLAADGHLITQSGLSANLGAVFIEKPVLNYVNVKQHDLQTQVITEAGFYQAVSQYSQPIWGVRWYSDMNMTLRSRWIPENIFQVRLETPSQVRVLVNQQSCTNMDLDVGDYKFTRFPLDTGINRVDILIKSSEKTVTQSVEWVYDTRLLRPGSVVNDLFIGYPDSALQNGLLSPDQAVTSFQSLIGLTDLYSGVLSFVYGNHALTAQPGLQCATQFGFLELASHVTVQENQPFGYGFGMALSTYPAHAAGQFTFNNSLRGEFSTIPSTGGNNLIGSFSSGVVIQNGPVLVLNLSQFIADNALRSSQADLQANWMLFPDLTVSSQLSYVKSMDEPQYPLRASLLMTWRPLQEWYEVEGRYTRQLDKFESRLTVHPEFGRDSRLSMSLYDLESKRGVDFAGEWSFTRDSSLLVGINYQKLPAGENVDNVWRYESQRGRIEFVASNDQDLLNRNQTMSLSMSSAIAMVDGIWAISRPISGAFMMVVPQACVSGYPVYFGQRNQTDALGPVVIPDLQLGQIQNVSVLAPTVPLDVDMGILSYNVYPEFVTGYTISLGKGVQIIVDVVLQDPEGKPLAYQSVTIRQPDFPDRQPQTAFTNKKGRLNVGGLMPGKIELDIGAYYQVMTVPVPETARGIFSAGVVKFVKRQ